MLPVLVLSSDPPKTYADALNFVGLPFENKFPCFSAENYGGLLLIGGGDVFPRYYGGNIPFKDENVVRDQAEFIALRKFVDLRRPVLGVCRGMQAINVFFGGTLKQVANHRAEKGDIYHSVSSRDFLSGITEVNSYHRQAIDRVAAGFNVCAVGADGCAESIRNENVFGVQFHPERMDERAITAVYGTFLKEIKSISSRDFKPRR